MANKTPNRTHYGSLSALGLTLATFMAATAIWLHAQPLLQHFYFRSFTKTAFSGNSRSDQQTKSRTFHVIVAGSSCVTGAFLTPETLPLVGTHFSVCQKQIDPGTWHRWLMRQVYKGGLFRALRIPLYVAGGFGFVAILFGLFWDSYCFEKTLEGTRLRGPETVTRSQFNRKVKGDGFPIVLENKRTFVEWLLRKPTSIRIKKKHENNHIITMADPGGGKSSLFMQILDEVERRG